MTYTNATVIIAATEREAAQADFPGSFVSGLYEAIEGADPAIATHYICSGLWKNEDLSKVANDVAWPCSIYFDDTCITLDLLNLRVVSTTGDTTTKL